MEREDRRSERKLVMKPIEYLLIPSIIRDTFDGLITDMSDSGLCLLTTAELKNHQKIIIQDRACSSEEVAIVKWSEKYDDIFYKVGIEFTKDEAFLNVKNKRRYKRLNIENLNMNCTNDKMAPANYIKIIDMSLDGLSIETDRKLDVGEEYILHLGYEGRTLSITGSITWSTVKHSESTNEGDACHIYRSGMRLTISTDEMLEFIKFIKLRLRQKRGEEQGYFYLSLDGLDIREENGKYLEGSLRSM